jgi:hypothetical protein
MFSMCLPGMLMQVEGYARQALKATRNCRKGQLASLSHALQPPTPACSPFQRPCHRPFHPSSTLPLPVNIPPVRIGPSLPFLNFPINRRSNTRRMMLPRRGLVKGRGAAAMISLSGHHCLSTGVARIALPLRPIIQHSQYKPFTV